MRALVALPLSFLCRCVASFRLFGKRTRGEERRGVRMLLRDIKSGKERERERMEESARERRQSE
jgi:hypothetical protein